MLQRLRIENYTILPKVDVQFTPGLNVITGETGVGKSLLLDAVGYILGDRRSGFPIRAGCHKAVVEAEFVVQRSQPIQTWLTANEFAPDFPLIIRREFQDNGRTRLFINDSPATLNQSRELGNMLLDLHGQHEAVALFDSARQLAFLDEYSQKPEFLLNYKTIYQDLQATRASLKDLLSSLDDSQAGWDTLRRQKQELNELQPRPGEIELLETELKRLENAERIADLCREISGRLNEATGSAVENLAEALRKLPELYPFAAELKTWETELENARAILMEANRTLLELERSAKHDPARVEAARQRLMALVGFRKRWNLGNQDLCVATEAVEKRLTELEQLQEAAQRLETSISEQQRELIATGQRLSQVRLSAARELEAQVTERLAAIAMSKADFKVAFSPLPTGPSTDGLERLDFTLSPDAKLPHQPLRQVASGGEMSRILLALKSALAAVDHVETLIFDEIDQGISGRIARMVGTQLFDLAQSHQIIVVTHLPQIASLGHRHFSVRQTDGEGVATVHPLDEAERIQELASLLTASGISEGAVLNAREMLDSAKALHQPNSI